MTWDTDLFTDATDPERVLSTAVKTLGQSLGVSRAWFGEINAALDTIDIVMDWVDGVPGICGKAPFRIDTPSVQQMLQDGVITVSDVDTVDIEPDLRERLKNDLTRSWISVPLMRGDRPVALIGVSHHEPREFSDSDVTLVREVGQKTWQALAHAHTLRRLRESQATLQHVTERFEHEPDPDAMLSMAAETLGRTIGVTRAFYGEIDADADTIDIIMDWTSGIPSVRGKFPFSIASQPVQQMLHTGATVVEDMDAVEMPEALREINRANDTCAWIAVPLMRGAKPVALISVTNSTPRSFTPTDVDLVREIGERTWQALVHAKTSRRLRDYQAAMDARAEHERFFRALGDEIRDDRDDVTILFKVATMLADHLGASSASFSEPDRDDPMIHDVYHHAARPTPHRTVHRVKMPASSAADLERLKTGQPNISRDAVAERGPAMREFLTEWQVGGFITMPIVEDGRVVMMLSVQTDSPRDWSESDVQLVRDLTERAWSAVTRVRAAAALAERERNQALLIAWNDAVRDEADPERVIEETLSRLDAAFGFLSVSFSEFDASGTVLEHIRVWQGGELRVEPETFALNALGPSPFIDLSGETTLAIENIASDARVPAESHAIYRDYGIAAVLVAPVFEGGRVTALLAMQSDQPRRWTSSERQVLRDLADRVWSTVTRVRTEALLAEREASQAFLVNWSDAVRDETDPEQVIAATLERLGTSFELLNVSFSELDDSGTKLENVRVWQAGQTYRDTRSLPIAALGEGLVLALRDGAPIAVEDVFRDNRIPASAHDLYREHGVASFLAAPIVSGERVVALLAMQADKPRRWSASEQGVLRELVERVWSKIERTRSEMALTRSRRALGQSEKMASMGAVLAGISHELNNPLAIVTAQAQLIAHIADGTELAERARRVHEAGDRCARIIQSFLAMARQTPPERQRAEPSEIVERATRQVAPAVADAGVVLRTIVGVDLPEVLVDPDQIHQLLVNLLVNAQHAVVGLPGAERQIIVRVVGREGRVLIEVADTGPGVPEAMRQRIFEPFFTTKSTGYGTGMGLALSQGLAELHGGTLTLEPSESGALFRLDLPAA